MRFAWYSGPVHIITPIPHLLGKKPARPVDVERILLGGALGVSHRVVAIDNQCIGSRSPDLGHCVCEVSLEEPVPEVQVRRAQDDRVLEFHIAQPGHLHRILRFGFVATVAWPNRGQLVVPYKLEAHVVRQRTKRVPDILIAGKITITGLWVVKHVIEDRIVKLPVNIVANKDDMSWPKDCAKVFGLDP